MTYVDTHVHFWDHAVGRYGWLPAATPAMGLAEYRAVTADDPPARFVFVEADIDPGGGAAEARWVHEMCAGEPDFGGMVVWAPIEEGRDAVHRHLDGLALDSVVGVRRLIQGRPDGFGGEAAFVDGVAALGTRGLAFDICIRADQFADAITLAAGVPDTRLVLDHCGKPPIAAGDLAGWARDVTRLATFDHVACKLSGLVTEAAAGWTIVDLRPVVDVVLHAFGPDRLLWGSDWPVMETAATHQRWRDATAELLAPLSESEREAVVRTTAETIYNLAGDKR